MTALPENKERDCFNLVHFNVYLFCQIKDSLPCPDRTQLFTRILKCKCLTSLHVCGLREGIQTRPFEISGGGASIVCRVWPIATSHSVHEQPH